MFTVIDDTQNLLHSCNSCMAFFVSNPEDNKIERELNYQGTRGKWKNPICPVCNSHLVTRTFIKMETRDQEDFSTLLSQLGLINTEDIPPIYIEVYDKEDLTKYYKGTVYQWIGIRQGKKVHDLGVMLSTSPHGVSLIPFSEFSGFNYI